MQTWVCRTCCTWKAASGNGRRRAARPQSLRTRNPPERPGVVELSCYYGLSSPWAEERDTSDVEVRRAIAEQNGMPGEELVAAERSVPVQQLFKAYSEEAGRLGVFGAPTYVLEGERFWGQDRLEFLDRALEAMGK
ncbi:MAG: hypothetical protein FJY51_12315 [Betaproteobacteria bacterium]|nr:hypothetical protein [Betaproteobacteria bacterium]